MTSGSGWLVLAAGLSQGSMLIASLLVANLLGVISFGRYALLQSTIMLLAGIAQLSFAVVIAQQVSSLRARNPSQAGEIAAFCFLTTLSISVLLAAALLAGRAYVSGSLFQDPNLADGLALAAFALPWVAASAVQQGLFNGLERFRDQAMISVVLVPLVVSLPPLGAINGGFEGALVGLCGTYVLRCLLSQLVMMRLFRAAGLRWALAGLRSKLALIWKFAFPATLAGIVTSLAVWGGQTLLVRSEGGAAALGLFAAAYLVKTMVMFIPTQMIVALLPVLSRTNATSAVGQQRGLLIFNTATAFLLTAAMAGVGMLAASWIMGLFGDDFESGTLVLVLLLLATPLEALTISLYQAIQSKGRFWLAFLSVNLPLAATVLTLAVILVPSSLALGLAMAWLAGWMVALGGTIIAVKGNAGSKLPENK